MTGLGGGVGDKYFRRRAAGATGEALRAALDAVPDNSPEPGDER